MDVRNCRNCGSIYNYVGGAYPMLCPKCIAVMEEKFKEVKKYIDEHKGATIAQVSDKCDIRVEQIEKWIREERLYIVDGSGITLKCEKCGTSITSGRFCKKCKMDMAHQFSNAFSSGASNTQTTTRSRDNGARMRFFDN